MLMRTHTRYEKLQGQYVIQGMQPASTYVKLDRDEVRSRLLF